MPFKTGGEAAEEAGKRKSFAKVDFFGLTDKETVIVRFLTDVEGWITVDQHFSVPTKPKPKDSKSQNWPELMGAVCRRSEGGDKKPMHEDCYICDFMADKTDKWGKSVARRSGRTWALACIREEKRDTAGKLLGYVDVMKEVVRKGPDGKDLPATMEQEIVLVNMAWSNFFGVLRGFADEYDTMLDRDYKITRKGDDKDTIYNIVPLQPFSIISKSGEHKGQKIRYDLRDPEIAALYETPIDLGAEVERRMSEEFYARFFDPRVEVSDVDGDEAVSETTAKPDTDAPPSDLKKLADRVQGYGPQEGEAPAATAEGAEEMVVDESSGDDANEMVMALDD